MSAHMTVIPKVNEKSFAASQHNTYVFDVPVEANKQQIATAVESQFNVTVRDVRVVVVKGKPVRASRGKRAYPGKAWRTTTKKAYVTFAEGDRLDIFDEKQEEKK